MHLVSFFKSNSPRNVSVARKTDVDLKRYLNEYRLFFYVGFVVLGLMSLLVQGFMEWKELFANLYDYFPAYGPPLLISVGSFVMGVRNYVLTRKLVKYGRIYQASVQDSGIVWGGKNHKTAMLVLHCKAEIGSVNKWFYVYGDGIYFEWNLPDAIIHVVSHKEVGHTLVVFGNEIRQGSSLKRKNQLISFEKNQSIM
ncbi:MAG: hypothetical protein CMK59_06450 [Proteobacteria bacterium]|nr:hypothetical protein [Pseudomonadota bacterium]